MRNNNNNLALGAKMFLLSLGLLGCEIQKQTAKDAVLTMQTELPTQGETRDNTTQKHLEQMRVNPRGNIISDTTKPKKVHFNLTDYPNEIKNNFPDNSEDKARFDSLLHEKGQPNREERDTLGVYETLQETGPVEIYVNNIFHQERGLDNFNFNTTEKDTVGLTGKYGITEITVNYKNKSYSIDLNTIPEDTLNEFNIGQLPLNGQKVFVVSSMTDIATFISGRIITQSTIPYDDSEREKIKAIYAKGYRKLHPEKSKGYVEEKGQ